MKLLFDQNLSHKLVLAVADLFPGSAHVRDAGLASAEDRAVWDFAKSQSYCIISKDDDFHQRSFLYGHPPKVIWVRLGNCTTAQVETAIRRHASDIATFAADAAAAFLAIS